MIRDAEGAVLVAEPIRDDLAAQVDRLTVATAHMPQPVTWQVEEMDR